MSIILKQRITSLQETIVASRTFLIIITAKTTFDVRYPFFTQTAGMDSTLET